MFQIICLILLPQRSIHFRYLKLGYPKFSACGGKKIRGGGGEGGTPGLGPPIEAQTPPERTENHDFF